MDIKDFQYDLPDSRIAKYPLADRDGSKLLLYRDGEVKEDVFRNIPKYIPSGSLMVFNNTRVIQARLHFRKSTGALIEIFCLEPLVPHDYQLSFSQNKRCSWTCLIGNAKKWKDETLTQTVNTPHGEVHFSAIRGGVSGTGFEITFEWDNDGVSFAEILEAVGELPIPPYLNRATEASDLETYQTVYSKIKGSVAAPTAGLHFTQRVLEQLQKKGVICNEITLHVGAGTFKPVKTATVEEHTMHAEWISVGRETIELLVAHNGRCIAVGTTSVRTLESLYYIGLQVLENPDADIETFHVEQWTPYRTKTDETSKEVLQALLEWMDRKGRKSIFGTTQIIIMPGYDYHVVKTIVTNFHQPQSTLLLLVSAFVKGDWHRIYDYALEHDFRFLSYGDSSLLNYETEDE